MPEKRTVARARKDKREGKSPSTQAGEFVSEEIHHVRSGKHGVRSTKQAIAIGLSKARKAGVKLEAAEKGQCLRQDAAQRDPCLSCRTEPAQGEAVSKALPRHSAGAQARGHRAASEKALSRQARQSARRRKRPGR